MTQALPVAYYLNDLDGDVPHRGGNAMTPGGMASDIEARIADAHARGILEGRTVAQGEAEAAREAFAAAAEQKLKTERQRWTDEEGARLARLLQDAMSNLETRIAGRVGDVLKPVLAEEVRVRAVAQLSDTLHDLLAKGTYAAVAVSGPDDLLTRIRDRLGADGEAVVFTATEEVDVSVKADDTIIEARIGAWVRAIQGEDE